MAATSSRAESVKRLQHIFEANLIQRGFIFYFTCKMCQSLGWKDGCSGKKMCGTYLYGKMQEHFARSLEVNGTSTGAVQRC